MVVVETSTAPIWRSRYSAPLATHWLIPLRTDSNPEVASEPPRLPIWQTGLRASSPVHPAACMTTAPGDLRRGSVQSRAGVEEEVDDRRRRAYQERGQARHEDGPASDERLLEVLRVDPERPGGGADQQA